MAAPDTVRSLEVDLRQIFGTRLLALVSYRPAARVLGARLHTLATIERFDVADLRACADKVAGWHELGLATPLILPAQEFARALDAFPLEFDAIIASHEVVSGADPFKDLRVDERDVRRACEVQVRSHLLHLREGYIETRGHAEGVAGLIADSVGPLGGLVMSVARLLGHPGLSAEEAADRVERTASLVQGSLSDVLKHTPVGGQHAKQLFPVYLAAIEQLTHFVDHWSHP